MNPIFHETLPASDGILRQPNRLVPHLALLVDLVNHYLFVVHQEEGCALLFAKLQVRLVGLGELLLFFFPTLSCTRMTFALRDIGSM